MESSRRKSQNTSAKLWAAAGVFSLVACTSPSAPPESAASSETPSATAAATATLAPVNNSPEAVKRCNRPADAKVLVTIDDSGTPEQVNKYLDELEKNNMKAAFFPTGEWAEDNLHLIGQIKAEGHIVGNHTYSHARLGELAVQDEAKFYGEIYPLEGVANTSPMLLRPPYEDGAYDPKVAEMLTEKNIQECTWTADSRDWDGSTVEQIMDRLKNGDQYTRPLERGGVVLFHKQSAHGAEAITPLAQYLTAHDMPYEQLHD